MERREAARLGLATYDNGNLCKRCNECSERYVCNCVCIKCAHERTSRSAEVARRYHASNKGKDGQKRRRQSTSYKATQKRWRERGGSHLEYKRNQETYKNNELLKRYGISLDQYNEMLQLQRNCCYICSRSFDKFKAKPNVDHCHSTGKVRKLLCVGCNTKLAVYENTDMMAKFQQYVQEHPS